MNREVNSRLRPRASVIIPVRDRPAALRSCLESLSAMFFADLEILVIDNSDGESTAAAVGDLPVRLLRRPGQNQFASRNIGIREALGEYLVFIDSDCLAAPDWLPELLAGYRSPAVGGVGGRLQSAPAATVVQEFLGKGVLDFPAAQGGLLCRREDTFLSGVIGCANASYRAEVLKEVGGFDEAYTVCGDYDLCMRVQEAGYVIAYQPDAVVYHSHRSTVGEMSRQFFQYGNGQALLFKKRAQGNIFFAVKTYLASPLRACLRAAPLRGSIELDFCNLLLLGGVAAAASTAVGLLLAAAVLLLGASTGAKVLFSRNSESLMRSLAFFSLHVVRIISFWAGKLSGSVQHRVVYL